MPTVEQWLWMVAAAVIIAMPVSALIYYRLGARGTVKRPLWVGRWAVEGEEKLLSRHTPSSKPLRFPATSAEMEFYDEIIRLQKLLDRDPAKETD